MLSPSTIFIDEADFLFRQPKSSDQSWERGQVTQLLREADGLRKTKGSQRPPFLLLASNHPLNLDPAVLRRTPVHFYLGHPDTDALRNIVTRLLREEDLDRSLSLQILAEKSERYTGSDLFSLCQQAKLNWVRELSSEQSSTDHGHAGRTMRLGHFQKLSSMPDLLPLAPQGGKLELSHGTPTLL